MNKKLLPILVFLFTSTFVYSQSCIPDTSIKTHGYYPAELDSAQEMAMYNMTMQVYSKRDTMVDNPFGGGKVNATIDSIIVTKVDGMPPGISYICNPPNCRFVSLKTHCINMFGTPPQGSAQFYPLSIKVTVKATIGGSFPTTLNENITDFGIFVKDDNISSNETLINTNVAIYPNPAINQFNIYNKLNKEGNVKVFSNTGKLMANEMVSAQRELSIDTKNWTMAVYYVIISYGDGTTISSNILIK